MILIYRLCGQTVTDDEPQASVEGTFVELRLQCIVVNTCCDKSTYKNDKTG